MVNAWITASELAQPSHPDAPFAAEAASWILYKLSGEKYPGVEQTTEVYLHETVLIEDTCWIGMAPVVTAGVSAGLPLVVSLAWSQNAYRVLPTRGRPIREITSITLGTSASGTLLDPSAYRIVNSARIIRLDGLAWDFNQGVQVSYSYGIQPPEAGKRAAAVLANEMIKLIDGDESCRLPERVTSISRQGVSFTIMDPNEFIRDNRVGIYEVDLFLQAANPGGKAKKRPKVFSPDVPRGERWR